MTDGVETMIETSPETAEFAKAMAKAQGDFQEVPKDAANPHFGSKYTSLAAILRACRPALNANGIYFSQCPSAGANAIQVTTRLEHGSGQFLQSTHTIPVSKNDAQGYGSGLTYARRQAAASILGIAGDEDDDGEGAVGRGSGSAKPPIPPKEPERPSLEKRASHLEKTLTDVKLLRDLDRAWKLAADLVAELRKDRPEIAARIDALHEKRHVELLGGAG